MSPPGAKTSPVPVINSPARSGSASTCLTAYRMPKYIAGVIALRASGRSSVHTPNGPSRVKRRNGVPSQSPSGGRGAFSAVVVIGLLVCRGREYVVDCFGGRGAAARARVSGWRGRPPRRRGAALAPVRKAIPLQGLRRRRRRHPWCRRARRRARARRRCDRRERSWRRELRGWSPDAVPANAIRALRRR